MSNKSRLQTNNTNLQALIDKANALPDAGGSGGGASVETCTVTVTPSYVELFDLTYTAINSDEAITVIYIPRADEATTLENVVVGSAITCAVNCISPGTAIDGDANLVNVGNAVYGMYSSIIISAANASISIWDDI